MMSLQDYSINSKILDLNPKATATSAVAAAVPPKTLVHMETPACEQ